MSEVVATWQAAYPKWDLSGMALLGRVSRIERLLDAQCSEVLRPHGLTTTDVDVLASPGAPTPTVSGHATCAGR